MEFNNFLNDWRNSVLGDLVKEKDDIEIRWLQGEMRAVDFLISLKSIVRDHIKGLSVGTQRKVENKDVSKK